MCSIVYAHEVHDLLAKKSGNSGPQDHRSSRCAQVLLGKPVCGGAFRKLLGVGNERFQKLRSAVKGQHPPPVDGRFFRRSLALSNPVVEYLEELYHSAGEHMPTGPTDSQVCKVMPFRRFQGKYPGARKSKSNAASTSQADPANLRCLPPGSFKDYWQLFRQKLQDMPGPPPKVGYKLFLKVAWLQR